MAVERLVILSLVQKKTQNTSKQQIERAKKLMKECFNEKENG